MTTTQSRIVTGIVLVVCGMGAIQGIATLLSPLHVMGTTWELQYYGDPTHPTPTLTYRRPTLAFAHTTVRGSLGCNSFRGGPFTAVGSRLELQVMNITTKACFSEAEAERGEIMGQESVYYQHLRQAETFTRNGNTLTLHTPDGILVFERSN